MRSRNFRIYWDFECSRLFYNRVGVFIEIQSTKSGSRIGLVQAIRGSIVRTLVIRETLGFDGDVSPITSNTARTLDLFVYLWHGSIYRSGASGVYCRTATEQQEECGYWKKFYFGECQFECHHN